MNASEQKLNLHLIGGWAYPASYLEPLADLLRPHMNVTSHPFSSPPTEPSMSDPYILAGWSLGALHALQTAIETKNKPKALVLISGTARFCADEGYPHGADRAALKSMIIGIQQNRTKTLQAFFAQSISPSVNETEIASRVKQAQEVYSDSALLAGLNDLDRVDLRGRAEQCTVPTILLHGANDRIIPSSASSRLAEAIPNSRLYIHDTAGHEMVCREADWVAEKLLADLPV